MSGLSPHGHRNPTEQLYDLEPQKRFRWSYVAVLITREENGLGSDARLRLLLDTDHDGPILCS